MSRFQYGQRVLILENDQWWPAKVVVPELVNQQLSDPDNVLVEFYGYNTHAECVDDGRIEAFDGNEKLTSVDENLRALAENDDLAYRPANVTVSKVRSAPPSKASEAAPKKKAHRKESTAQPVAAANARPHEPGTAALAHVNKEAVSVQELQTMKLKLESALAAHDQPTVRGHLLQLVKCDMTYDYLQQTGLGKVVCAVWKDPSMELVAGLARILIRTWARLLPAVTLNAIRNHAAAKNEPARAPGAGESLPAKNKEHFSQALRDALSDCDPDLVSNVERVAEDLEHAARNREERLMLTTVLGKKGHHTLRRKLLTGEMTAPQFFLLRGDDLLTPDEVGFRQRQLDAEIEAREAASQIATSEMYECEKCHARKTTYYQQQTRGGDEPMTLFVKCRNCNYEWTQE